MRCPKCDGNILEDPDDPYCLQCGCRTFSPVYPPAKRHRNQCIPKERFKGGLLEEYLNETLEETEKVKCFLRQHLRVRHMLDDLWHKDKLAQSFTLRHAILLDCYSALGENACELLEHLNTRRFLDRYSLLISFNELPRPHGGRRWDARTIDLAIKLVACASYQWLLERETEREMAMHPGRDSRSVRPWAHARLKSAHRLSRRILMALGPDIDLRHAAVTRALWEDKYRPIVLFEKGLTLDICY